MANTISRDELKEKIDRGDDFLLVETLPATGYHHNHLPEAINLITSCSDHCQRM
jgi:hypothetical protein